MTERETSTSTTTPAPRDEGAPSAFVSIRVVTDDVQRLVGFYEQVTGVPAQWGNDLFAELVTPAGTVAIASTRTIELFGAGAAHAADNHSVIIEFRVHDVDDEYRRLRALDATVVLEPTTQPWGNRSLLLRDPDGNLINIFSPAGARPAARRVGSPS
jgi:predicted enzyme related to lactoylglutathione lyase